MSKAGGGFFVAGVAGVGGSGSVTSNEASAISAQAASAINVVSNAVSVVSQAVSVLSQQNSVEHAALSVRVDTVSQQASVLSQAVSVISQTVSVHSQRFSTLGGGATSAYLRKTGTGDFAWEWGSVVAGGVGSVTSAQRDVLSQGISALSVQAALVDGEQTHHIWEQIFPGTNISIIQIGNAGAIEISAAGGGSVTSAEADVISNATSNALSVANAASNAASVVSQAVSVLSQANSAAHVSINNAISIVSQQVSILSQAVSVISQSNSVLSQAVSVLSQAVSVLSNNVSVLSNLVCGPVLRVLSTIQTISATTLTNISGFSVSVVAAGVYRLDAMLMVNRGAAAQNYGYGMTFPAMKFARGIVFEGTSVVQTDPTILGQVAHHAVWEGDSASGSVILSTVSAALLSTIIGYTGLFKVSTGGVLQLQALGSTVGAALQIMDGSYMQVFRLE